MKPAIKTYLKSLNLSKVLEDAIKSKYEFLAEFTQTEFDDILITESMSKSGNREYFELYVFSNDYIGYSSIVKTDIGFYKLKNFVTGLFVDEADLKLASPDNNARLNVAFRRINSEELFELLTSGKNCSQALRVIRKYLIPNLADQ